MSVHMSVHMYVSVNTCINPCMSVKQMDAERYKKIKRG